MRNINFNFLVFLLVVGILLSCEHSNDAVLDENQLQEQEESNGLTAKKGSSHSVPFKAKFFTVRNYDTVIGTCVEAPYLEYNHQKGEGTGTHLGKFTIELFFCGSGLDYKNGEGSFVAANGDELRFIGPSHGEIGHVVPLTYAHPLYEFQFQDPFTIIGGTGRFEGASGGGYMNSFVDLFVDGDPNQFIREHRTDHEWTGTLVLKNKKKRKNRR